ncbi:hypothetical protein [Deinococcus maricopensis]|uniref:Uncharacterized protein n=1 Tax=Deinococcus maricopensis (strain DSM 21211 / LMG 22137 / NRRL B-23946 / LB-34) TaxID=709986 RepID=E8UAJ6_DEIML|nr:hypothetical protein [Deinococcus maricopensis]ADV68085.1 hypothetical protein Deima_2450 [Deinococcus maricopensis DSM 21211]
MDALLQTPLPSPTDEVSVRAHALAAEAVLALSLDRPAVRVSSVSVRGQGGVVYASRVLPEAARLNRALLEEDALVRVAGAAARELQGLTPGSLADAEDWLRRTLNADEAQEVSAYARVLLARARGVLRAQWTEVSVVALGLQAHGTLDAQEVRHRVQCARGIRGALLN